MNDTDWTDWQPFPDPRACGYLHAPFGAGGCDLRHRSCGELIYCGRSKNVALRMSSLLPSPLGVDTRNNAKLRQHVDKHLADIEFRTLACASRDDAKAVERNLKAKGGYFFST